MKLTEHRALILDVYGTLIDWESAIHDALAPVFPHLSREAILLKYAQVEGRLQTQFPSTPYPHILELAHRQLMASSVSGTTTAGVTQGEPSNAQPSDDDDDNDDSGAQRFGRSIAHWKPFPDTLDALHRLKRHFALVVLSNVDAASFALTHAQLCTDAGSPSADSPGSAYPTLTPDSPFSLVLTAQHVGAYKPDPAMLASALRQLSADPGPDPDPSLPVNDAVRVDQAQVLVVANSLRHDIVPAARRGLRSVWIRRYGVNVIGSDLEGGVGRCVEGEEQEQEQEGATVDRDRNREGGYPYTWRYETLGSLADAVEREVQEGARRYDVV